MFQREVGEVELLECFLQRVGWTTDFPDFADGGKECASRFYHSSRGISAYAIPPKVPSVKTGAVTPENMRPCDAWAFASEGP